MKDTEKNLSLRLLLFCAIGVILVIGAIQYSTFSDSNPSYTGNIERRDYELFMLPLEGPSFAARMDRIKYRINKPGQAKLISLFTGDSPPSDFQTGLEILGYQFPRGTEAVSGHLTTPNFYIKHYPDVLDSLESEFHLERRKPQ